MAEYLILDEERVYPQGVVVEGKNMREAVGKVAEESGGKLQVYRIATGPVEVNVRTETNTVFDFGSDEEE